MKLPAETFGFFDDILDGAPFAAVVTGSGMGNLLSDIEDVRLFRYSEIPSFPVTNVSGHPGILAAGKTGGIGILLFRGRFHHYEGYSPEEVVMPVLLSHALGVRYLILTNTSGAVNRSLEAGDFVIVKDHINLMGTNPLLAVPPQERNPAFLDLTEAYSPVIRSAFKSAAADEDAEVREGVLAAVMGPCYETPAEIDMLRIVGADIVSMSAVPEVIAANYVGLAAGCISTVTNSAAEEGGSSIDHPGILAAAGGRVDLLSRLIKETIEETARVEDYSG